MESGEEIIVSVGELELDKAAPPKPMSVGATVGMTFAIGAIAVVAQIIFMVLWAVVAMVGGQSMNDTDFLLDGNLVFGSVLFSYPFVIGSLFAVIHFREGLSLKEYLGWYDWRKLKVPQFLPWFGGLIGIMMVFELMSGHVDTSKAEMMEAFILSADPWVISLALVIGAPLVEELFFRGYMFKSFEGTRLGGVGTVLVTALVWVLIHGFQYGLVELVYLMLIGVLLGVARLKTGAICLPLALHVVNNLIVVVSLLFGRQPVG